VLRTVSTRRAAQLTAEFIEAEKMAISKLMNVRSMPNPNKSVSEEIPKESLLTSLDPAEKEEETKSYYKLLGLCGVGYGGNLVKVDCKNGRILRIRPVHYEWAHTKEELEKIRWEVEAKGEDSPPKMKELAAPFAIVYKNRVYSPNRVRYPIKEG
jgi:hypothetical protein